MCHSCRGESVLCEQRHERSEPDCTGGGGRTYNPRARTQREREGGGDTEGCAWYQVAVREGVCYSDLLFLLQTPPPPLSESLPPTSLDLCSRLPVPERLPKV